MDQPLNSSFDPMHDDEFATGAVVPVRSVAQEQEHRKRIQKLVIVCFISVGVVVAAFFIGRASKKASEPDTTQWVRGPWSTCSEKCGGGVMTRTVFCANGDGDPVPSDLCPTNEANPLQLPCNTQQCAYDFVVVGGGSAGCVMAARLSEDPTKTVLLLESGGPSQVLAKSEDLSGDDYVEVKECRPPMVCDSTDSGDRLTRFDVPYYWMTLPWTAYRRYTWNYTGLALGEVLGGSGAINAMIYVRAIKQDFDDWVAAGNPGWTWDTALNYYKKTENNTDPSIASDTAHHSTTGPMHVSTPTYFDLAGQLFTQAATAYGIPHLTDFNGPNRFGVGNYQFNKHDGVRDSTLRALLGPALARGNLEVRLFSRAMKINFAGTTAKGVTYLDRITGESITVGANKEVILTAGAINTAKLLLLSGVGDQGQLAKAKIPLVLHSPGVGQNLHDHTSVNVVYDFPTANYPSAYIIPLGPLDQYAWSQTGLISSSILATGAFVKSPYTVNDFPDIQFTVWPKDLTDNSDTQSRAWSVSVTLNRPISRGNLTLNASNPTGEPILSQVNLLEQIDIDAIVWGIKTVRQIVKFAPLNTSLTTERSPGAQYQTDSELAAFIQQPGKAVLGNHWVGSAKMGPASDPMAVVDSNLLVRGLNNVRVADASMTPAITNGNVHATVIMCAERAADIVKSAYP